MDQQKAAEWADAQRRCRMSAEAIAMAKELGMTPRSLTKNIPSKSQPWKAPVEEWVRDLYFKRFGRTAHPSTTPARIDSNPSTAFAQAPPPTDRPPNLFKEAEDELWAKCERGEVDPEMFSATLSEIERETPVSDGEIEEQNDLMLRRWQSFRLAAEKIAAAFAQLPFVEQVMLIGSVAAPLRKEVPRFRRLRRAGVKIYHECKDVDLAVWVGDLTNLRQLKKAINGALNEFNQPGTHLPGVPYHAVDIFLFEPGTNRYRGHLCTYSACPKGKPDCEVAGCGAQPFLQLYADFQFDRLALFAEHNVVLFERQATTTATGPDNVPF